MASSNIALATPAAAVATFPIGIERPVVPLGGVRRDDEELTPELAAFPGKFFLTRPAGGAFPFAVIEDEGRGPLGDCPDVEGFPLIALISVVDVGFLLIVNLLPDSVALKVVCAPDCEGV